MKLATICTKKENASRDGQLTMVDDRRGLLAPVPEEMAGSLIEALENWSSVEPKLREFDATLKRGELSGTLSISEVSFCSPLPRAYSFLDGSAYLSHVRRARKSRGAEMPAELERIPLMYQGVSAPFLGPEEFYALLDEKYGADFEAEIAVILDDTPMGVSAEAAESHIKLLILLNDISLRNLIPDELARGFGFLHGKPSSSCAPFAVTLDELGGDWSRGRAALQVKTGLNNKNLGDLRSEEMHFSFADLIHHAARTRALPAGSIIGSGTVSNENEAAGIGCLMERRVIEVIANGKAQTEYLKRGDEIYIEAFRGGKSVFGAIKQKFV